MALQFAGVASLLQNARLPDFDPKFVSLKSPPALTGALDAKANSWLTRAKAYANNVVRGPESMVVVENYVYTGLADGWVVEIQPARPNGRRRNILRMASAACGDTPNDETCGRPLGVRVDSQGYLIVADPYKGIFRIHPRNGVDGRWNLYKRLVDPKTLVNNKTIGYISDFDVAKDGTIYFSSASSKWSYDKDLNIFLEGETSGRVLAYYPSQKDPKKRFRELVSILNYPDGLQLSKDESYLLIAERARARIYKAFVGNTPKQGIIEVFSDNLPGFVANIRLSPRGTYWVALQSVRHMNAPSLLDRFGNQPGKRLEYMTRPPAEVKSSQFPRHGMALELNENGQIIRNLQDPTGILFPSVSEVQEFNGILFVASPDRDYIGLLSLRNIPEKPYIPPVGPGTGTGPMDSSDLVNRTLALYSERLKTMSGSQVREALLSLLVQLVYAMAELKRATAGLNKVENDLLQLRTTFNINSGLTSHQKQLIRTSWGAYNKGSGVLEDTVLIFVRLFNETPDARPLFSYVPEGGTTEEALLNNTRFMALVGKVAGSLQTIVSNMDNLSVLAKLVRDLGARHAGYGTQLHHFPPVKAGIFDAMRRRLGPALTIETQHAWGALLDFVFSNMKQGMSRVQPANAAG